jgi:hypothetical protein
VGDDLRVPGQRANPLLALRQPYGSWRGSDRGDLSASCTPTVRAVHLAEALEFLRSLKRRLSAVIYCSMLSDTAALSAPDSLAA